MACRIGVRVGAEILGVPHSKSPGVLHSIIDHLGTYSS